MRLLKDAQKASNIDPHHAFKWQDFANQLIENIPVAHLNEYDLAKLQTFTITLNTLDILDKAKHETMLRWAICERYNALKEELISQVNNNAFGDIITAIEQLCILGEEKLSQELLLKLEK